MPNLYLGPSGSEVVLPTLTGKGAAVADVPVRLDKLAVESVQSDGSKRFGFIAIKRQWSYSWALLTETEKETIQTLYNMGATLNFQDSFESETWYSVFFSVFSFAELRGMSSATDKYYSASIVLVEI
ncbi:MAG: hypothetical protein WC329_05120 [Candidatus Omnitrophota bacterium]|jgi:hypothetical protein